MTTDLHSMPDDQLLLRLGELARESRRVEADLVAHIGEVDARRLYLRFAFSSMYSYCTEALHLTEAEAYRRIRVARAAREHPVLLTMLRDGRLHVTGLALLVGRLTPANRDEVLRRATLASTRDIERLVAELEPRPDVPSGIRKLPMRPGHTRQPRGGSGGPRSDLHAKAAQPPARWATLDAVRAAVSHSQQPTALAPQRPDALDSQRPDALDSQPAALDSQRPAAPCSWSSEVPDSLAPSAPLAPIEAGTDDPGPAPAPDRGSELFARRVEAPLAGQRRAVVQPLSPGRYKVQFTAREALRQKLERLSELMRSEVAKGDLASLIECAVDEKLERLEARRFGAVKAPRKTIAQSDVTPRSRHIPAAIRRAVRARDGDRCRYVDELGRRCSESRGLEFHHRYPYGMGGDHGLDNIRQYCQAHNQYLGEVDYRRAVQQPVARTPEAHPPHDREPTSPSS